MGELIDVEINSSKYKGLEDCGKCIGVCPVNIFKKRGAMPIVIEKNEDE